MTVPTRTRARRTRKIWRGRRRPAMAVVVVSRKDERGGPPGRLSKRGRLGEGAVRSWQREQRALKSQKTIFPAFEHSPHALSCLDNFPTSYFGLPGETCARCGTAGGRRSHFRCLYKNVHVHVLYVQYIYARVPIASSRSRRQHRAHEHIVNLRRELRQRVAYRVVRIYSPHGSQRPKARNPIRA